MERIFKPLIGDLAIIAKHPLTWALVILGVLVGTIMQQWIKSNDRINANCEAENARLREENKQKDDRLINLYNAILLRDQQLKIVDSMAKEKVGEKSKEIVEQNDTRK